MVPLISVPFHRQVPPASSLIRQYLDQVPKSHRKPSREAAKLSTNLQLKLNTPQSSSLRRTFSSTRAYSFPWVGVGGLQRNWSLFGQIPEKCPQTLSPIVSIVSEILVKQNL